MTSQGNLIHFDAERVRQLLYTATATNKHRGCFEQNYSVEYLRDDITKPRLAEIMSAADSDGLSMTIKPDTEIDQEKIPAGLWLVGDEGIYLMSNAAKQDKLENGKLPIAYADECNPETMGVDEAYSAKRRIFGGDDGVEFLPAELLSDILAHVKDKLVILMDAEGFQFMI